VKYEAGIEYSDQVHYTGFRAKIYLRLRLRDFKPSWLGEFSGKFSTQGKGKCYRQNNPDRTSLRILDFADNKDLHGGGLSEPLISVPVIDGTQLEMKIKPPSAYAL
jgi:hypothetical protein